MARADIIHGILAFRIWTRLGWQEVKRRYRRTVFGPFWDRDLPAMATALQCRRSRLRSRRPPLLPTARRGALGCRLRPMSSAPLWPRLVLRPLGRARSEVGDGLSPNLTSDEYSQNRCVGVAQCPLPSKETKIEENPRLRTPINRHRRPPGISSAAVELRVIEPRGRRRGDRAIRDFGASASFLRRRRSTRRLESIPTDREEIDRAVRGRQIDGLFLSGLAAALGYSQCSFPSAAITLRATSTTLLNSVSWPSNCMWQRLLKPKSHMMF